MPVYAIIAALWIQIEWFYSISLNVLMNSKDVWNVSNSLKKKTN